MAKKKQRLPEKKSGLKTIHIILALLVISALAIYFLNSGGKGPENLPDDNYKKLNTTIETGKVKIIEFLNFGCSHCNDLRKNMPQLRQKYGAKVEITYIPINFVSLKQSTKSVEAYIIAEQMGKGDEMLDALFDAKFDKGMDILESTIAIETVAASIGLGSDFNQKLLISAYRNAMEDKIGSDIEVSWKKKTGESVKTKVIIVPISYMGELLALHFISKI